MSEILPNPESRREQYQIDEALLTDQATAYSQVFPEAFETKNFAALSELSLERQVKQHDVPYTENLHMRFCYSDEGWSSGSDSGYMPYDPRNPEDKFGKYILSLEETQPELFELCRQATLAKVNLDSMPTSMEEFQMPSEQELAENRKTMLRAYIYAGKAYELIAPMMEADGLDPSDITH